MRQMGMKHTSPEELRVGFRVHAVVFAAVLTLMLLINALTGPPYWVAWVALSWGIGLLSHGLAVRSRLHRIGRTLLGALALALVTVPTTHAQGRATGMNIVLVHGAWADGSGWQRVHDDLQARGHRVTIVQNPLTSLADDVAAVHRVLARQEGPTLLVGHSYGGAVITEAGNAANVAGLVYVAAFVPDAGESVASLTAGGPPPPLQPSKDGFLFFDLNVFPQAFAQDLPAAHGAFLAASQVPPAGVAFGTPVTTPAWKSRRSWFVLPADDRVIPPAAQEQMAQRAKAAITRVPGSHMVYLSQPQAVADAIDAAAKALASK